MKINLQDYSPASRVDLDILADSLGHELRQDYVEFLARYNGAKPESNLFAMEGGSECGVDRFIPCKDVVKERARVDHVSRDLIPVAWAEGGNYILQNLVSGKIYFWDHELPDEPIELTSGIFEFLDILQPFDANSVEIKDGQVESAWIDPDFLKSLR